ncbi:DUF3445 domain-containing protein [Chloroflexus sp.]|uniref:heme-dependent oxidative N-demethylase family protein n=1 Tax=Chloroflexus sp. TaxID=1904827 RepID=UPI00298F3630|nr:DUF3445 domain-containing protein [Chloroflexus sp.]MDW8404954.1 DUF3445 domain-containing protein [Chloroflexus sp.]
MVEAWPFDPFVIPTSQVLRVGAYPLHGAPVFHVDPNHYHAELALKQALLQADHRYYMQAYPESLPAQWELLEWGVAELARSYPQWFVARREGAELHWENRLLNQTATIRIGGDLGLWPIDWLGRQVQEDLLLMKVDEAAGHPLIAGQLCFPNRWCLDDKMGLPLAAIHGPVPRFSERLAFSTDQLVARLQPHRPVWRRNWSLVVLPDLDLSPRLGPLDREKAAITADNAGERIFYRVERQTLVRLTHHPAVLFTVRTYVAPLVRLAADPQWAAALADLLQQVEPSILAYKGVQPYLQPLLAYLQRQSQPVA